MKINSFNSQSGISLIEILVVLVVTVILVTFAVARFGNTKNRFQRENIAREFKVNLERARFDSVKRRPSSESDMSRVTINSATSFTVATDLNQDGVLSASETRDVDFSSQSDMRILAASANFPIDIRFDRRGGVTVKDKVGATVASLFTICNESCNSQTASSDNSNIISISPTGTVAMTVGGVQLPVFPNPTVTPVANTANINPKVSISPSNYPSY